MIKSKGKNVIIKCKIKSGRGGKIELFIFLSNTMGS